MRITCKQAHGDQQLFLAFKIRSFATELADLIYKHFPRTKCLFLYRNAETWFDSFMRAFYGSCLFQEEIVEWRLWCKPMVKKLDTYPIKNPSEINVGLMFSLMWLSEMESCLRLIETGHPILPVRYEGIKANPLSVMMRFFDYCSVQPENESALAEVFVKDSQVGTPLAWDQVSQRMWDLDAELLEIFRQVIAEHPVIQTPDYHLPGTLIL